MFTWLGVVIFISGYIATFISSSDTTYNGAMFGLFVVAGGVCFVVGAMANHPIFLLGILFMVISTLHGDACDKEKTPLQILIKIIQLIKKT
jgi:hypothetical protein